MGRSELVQCGKCGLNFLHEEGLGKHMKRVHEPKEKVQPSRYKCDRCADEFESKDAFKQHKLPELLDCELCKRRGEVSTLSSKCEHSFHIITHRTGRPKVCDNCGSEFKNNKNLKNHLEAERTVSCRRCNLVFNGSCPLQKHIRNEHDLTREPLPAMVRTRPLDSSKGFKTTLVKTESAKTTRPEDLPVTASVFEESNEIEEALDEPLLKKLKVKLNFHHPRDENLEPLNDTIPQEYLLQPELLPGWASNESVLGI